MTIKKEAAYAAYVIQGVDKHCNFYDIPYFSYYSGASWGVLA